MIAIREIDNSQSPLWDAYVNAHPQASVYHCSAFRNAVEKTYGHKTSYLAAFDEQSQTIVGVLPLFFVSGPLFGKNIVSLGFCDYGGILYDNEESGKLLLEKAVSLLHTNKFDFLELRQTFCLPFLQTPSSKPIVQPDCLQLSGEKVRMKLALPDTSEKLFKSFDPKLRSQIRKPQKEGCVSKNGGMELLDDFYSVFVHNMRDLGSPVHAKAMMANTLKYFGTAAQIFVVYKDNVPIACSLVAGMKASLVNPWASFNKKYRPLAPNMLLYWSMMEYAIANKYESFDFGRSTKEEGTYRFKEQWGAKPEPLFWYYVTREKATKPPGGSDAKKELFIKVWQKLPLVVTKIVGPIIRKQIPL